MVNCIGKHAFDVGQAMSLLVLGPENAPFDNDVGEEAKGVAYGDSILCEGPEDDSLAKILTEDSKPVHRVPRLFQLSFAVLEFYSRADTIRSVQIIARVTNPIVLILNGYAKYCRGHVAPEVEER